MPNLLNLVGKADAYSVLLTQFKRQRPYYTAWKLGPVPVHLHTWSGLIVDRVCYSEMDNHSPGMPFGIDEPSIPERGEDAGKPGTRKS